jgi:DNA polymerase-3 subunit alpha
MKLKKQSWRKADQGVFLPIEKTEMCPSGDLQLEGNNLIMSVAKKAKLPLLLTLDSHFVRPDQKLIQDLVLQNGKEEGIGMRFSNSYNMMTTERAWKKWMYIHGTDKDSRSAFQEAVENNKSVVDMCSPIEFNSEYRMPEVEIPYEIRSATPEGSDPLLFYVHSLIEKYGRMVDSDEYRARLEMEIEVISKNGKINFLPYFITLHDVCVVANNIGIITGIGRGSAGGCLLAYLLKITHKDPIKYGLSFERFLSIGRINRGKFPDIDMDFSDTEKLANALKDIYGDKIVRICTLGTNKLKGAVRDVCRVVLDTKNDKQAKVQVDLICDTISNVPQGVEDLNKWLDGYEDDTGHILGELERNKSLKNFFSANPTVESMVRAIIGVPKSIGRHAAAFCITDAPVHQLIPICSIKDEICTQFTMGPVEKMGLVKFDMLGLNTLNDIGGCVKLIKERHGVELDIYNLPEDDEDVYKDFQDGRTETVFQFNGPIPTSVCKKIKPKSLMELAAITAACRPGTLYAEIETPAGKQTLIDLWISRKNGVTPVTYVNPSLKNILKDTCGIFLFQEQLNKMFVECCGYTPEQADEMREIIGKKKKDKMDQVLPDIRSRLKKNKWKDADAQSIISLCIAASSYVFNLNHSVTYSALGYVCMYLKHYYPLEWWTSILQNSTHADLEKYSAFFKRYLVCPDVNVSDVDFYIIDSNRSKIVYPLSMIKGVKTAAEEIIKNKPFSSLKDFFDHCDKRVTNKRVVGAMIWGGAFDLMPEAEGEQIWTKRNNLYRKYYEYRGEKIIPTDKSKSEIMQLESLSLCIGEPDILSLYKIAHPNSNVQSIPEILHQKEGVQIRTLGVISDIRELKTKSGKNMCFVYIGNSEHKLSVTVFPEEYQAYRDKLQKGAIIKVVGKVNIWNERVSVITKEITFYDPQKL